MLFKVFTVAVALASSIAAYPLVINTPAEAQQCVPTLVTWEGGVPSYQLKYAVISGGHLIGLFLDIDATQFLWPTNVTAGTTVALQIVDSIGQAAQTGSFVIQPGSTGC
ncbi:hypothetical protein C8Q70DRAFT_1055551 [Cubamyces menziesii]|uniref:Uncharacterized protein n=1 Tax=Trametes cubensis TaxID=1111947 RepID=A0AAD7XEF6_9APHY|nr:hypothetical protein C8Q70DRAFT_1055551 [Cubamyces menziesii]KAJ8490131.1 hypothetical protein ONZ51_g2511 [Trametes cubensis]